MKVEEYGESVAYDVAFWMQGFARADYPIGQMGNLSLELSEKLRALAIISLVTQAETDTYYHNLIRSGLVRVTYLERLRRERLEDEHHDASGRYDALVDAIAAADWDLSARISSLSRAEWRQGHEYEDDYCYAQLLQRFSSSNPVDVELGALLERFEGALDGVSPHRLNVCRALAARDQDAFDESFEELLGAHEDKLKEEAKLSPREDPAAIAIRRVFVEGLSLLRLAGKRGLTTQPEYPLCPSLALVPMSRPFPGE